MLKRNFKQDDEGFYIHLPCIRTKSKYKQTLIENNILKELKKEYKIKNTINKEILFNRNNYSDENISAFSERKCWKRNSKRKRQFKGV